MSHTTSKWCHCDLPNRNVGCPNSHCAVNSTFVIVLLWIWNIIIIIKVPSTWSCPYLSPTISTFPCYRRTLPWSPPRPWPTSWASSCPSPPPAPWSPPSCAWWWGPQSTCHHCHHGLFPPSSGPSSPGSNHLRLLRHLPSQWEQRWRFREHNTRRRWSSNFSGQERGSSMW